jgi:hypothetical protein
MSIRSKAKRDANRKKRQRERIAVPARAPGVEAHADLRDGDGTLLGGIARREGQWVLGLDGRIVGESASAATLLAMLRRAAAMQERSGGKVTLRLSDALRAVADEESRAQGMTFEQFEAQLDGQLREASGEPGQEPPLAH